MEKSVTRLREDIGMCAQFSQRRTIRYSLLISEGRFNTAPGAAITSSIKITSGFIFDVFFETDRFTDGFDERVLDLTIVVFATIGFANVNFNFEGAIFVFVAIVLSSLRKGFNETLCKSASFRFTGARRPHSAWMTTFRGARQPVQQKSATFSEVSKFCTRLV